MTNQTDQKQREAWVPAGGRRLRPYVLAVVLTLATLGLRMAFGHAGEYPTLIVFTIPIILSAYWGGLKPGLLATLIAYLGASYYLLPPIHSFTVADTNERWQQITLILTGTIISVICELLHRSRKRAEDTSIGLGQRERELKEAQKEASDLKTALDEHAIVARTDPDGKITYVNDKFCQISKFSREELLGQDHRIINSGHHAKEFIRDLWTTIEQGKVWRGEIKNKAKDSSCYWVDTTIVPILNADGKPYQYVAIHADITERKQAEEVMARLAASSLARLAAIVEFSDDAIIGKDLQGVVTSWNAGAEKLLGIWASEIVGQPIMRIIPPGRRQEEKDILARIARGESVKHFETERVHKDGSLVPVSVTISPIKDLAGKIVGASTVARDDTEHQKAEAQLRADITERQHQAEALAHSNKALERSNVELAQFAYVASHDLQTPLRNISGFVQLLKANYAGKLDAKADGWIGHIVQSSTQMHTLIQDVLTYSRVDSRARPFEAVSLRDVFNDSVGLLEASIQDCGGEVTCGELPTVMGDRSQLVQLLQNLIGNALKYHGERPPLIHVSAERNGNGDGWSFSVHDNGIGIAPKHHERIFEIFKRLHNQQEYPGTGIGLAVCRRVAHRHGGEIWVESEAGVGSTFKFTIPEKAVEEPGTEHSKQ